MPVFNMYLTSLSSRGCEENTHLFMGLNNWKVDEDDVVEVMLSWREKSMACFLKIIIYLYFVNDFWMMT